jgi:hypothetical protein
MTLPKPDRDGWMKGALADAPACPPFPDFTDFERCVLEHIAPLFGNQEKEFRRQLDSAEVTDRINTIVGFYTRVRVDRASSEPVQFRQQGAHFEVEGVEHGISVILWDKDRDGYLETIEGFTVDDNSLDGGELAALKLIRMTQPLARRAD